MNYKINTTIVSIFGKYGMWASMEGLPVSDACTHMRGEHNVGWYFIQEVSIHIAGTEKFKGLFWESLSQPNSSKLKGRSICLFTWYVHTLCLQVVRDWRWECSRNEGKASNITVRDMRPVTETRPIPHLRSEMKMKPSNGQFQHSKSYDAHQWFSSICYILCFVLQMSIISCCIQSLLTYKTSLLFNFVPWL